MKKLLLTSIACAGLLVAQAQFQVNPQMGVTFQNLTNSTDEVSYRAAMGWQLGTDLRFGDRAFFQPGAFIGRSATMVTQSGSETSVIEDGLVRTSLKLRAQVGYRLVDSYQFDIRLMAGPSYDVLMSVDNKDGNIEWNKGDFNKGSMNIEAGLALDMGMFTLSPTASFGLNRVFDNEAGLKGINSRFITYGLTIGMNFGDDDK